MVQVAEKLSQEDFKLRNLKTDMRFSHKRFRFNLSVASAYDTKFYRKEPVIESQKWDEVDVKEYFRIKETQKKIEEAKKEEEKLKQSRKKVKGEDDDWRHHPLFEK